MLALMVAWIIEGYRDPRASMRRLLAVNNGGEVAALLFLLAFAIEGALQIALGTLIGADARASGTLFAMLLFRVFVFVGFAGMVHIVCRAAGGVGTPLDSALALAWNMLVTAVLAPLPILVTQGGGATQTSMDPGDPQVAIDPVGLFFVAVYGAVAIWLLSAYLAEAHGFQRIWKVAASFIGASLFTGTVIMMLGSA